MKFGRKPGVRIVGGIPTPDAGSDPSDSPREAPAGEGSARGKSSRSGRRSAKGGFRDGQMLIAMPTMGDERFARSVIYVCAHSSEGAMGIIVNHPAANISFPDLLVQLDVIPATDRIGLPAVAGGVKV